MSEYTSAAWPYIEAQKLANRQPHSGGTIMTFETGFGASGLPHVGTFAEVARTTMVRRAYEDIMGYLPNQNTRLIVFSDDLDAMRKVPDNIPNREEINRWLEYSVSRIPDPWEKYQSFAHHNNAKLCEFLDEFGFDYEFRAASQWYGSLEFQGALRAFHLHHDVIRDIIIPTLGDHRASSYSPFLPITQDGRVLQAEIVGHDFDKETLTYIDPVTDVYHDISIFDCKLQWKADWAMRWFAQEIDYEMCGKDLTDSLTLSSQILRALGNRVPDSMIYEMFLDENGHKISKSKGNGLTMEQWLRYGSADSLISYLFRTPQKAKKLHVEIVPRAEDDLKADIKRYDGQDRAQQLGNSAHYVVRRQDSDLSYQLLLNLAETANVDSADTLLAYVENQRGPQTDEVKQLVKQAFLYYDEVYLCSLPPRDTDIGILDLIALFALHKALSALETFDEETIQKEVYLIGNAMYREERLREWFRALYRQILGRDSGPRFGALAVLLGKEKTLSLLMRGHDI